MIDAIILNLQRGVKLLNSIDDHIYRDNSVAPYYSSIGGHMRHILDIFDCAFEGMDSRKIDLTKRKRNVLAEEKTAPGLQYFYSIIENLEDLKDRDLNFVVNVKDDLGLGIIETEYTMSSLLIQAHSHAIHHFASLGYVNSQLGIELPDPDFGYNPSTPRNKGTEV